MRGVGDALAPLSWVSACSTASPRSSGATRSWSAWSRTRPSSPTGASSRSSPGSARSSRRPGGGGVNEEVVLVVGKGAFSRLKFEGGVHRVQRVPVTETQGRIHTSAVTVAVLPEAEDVEVELADKDLRIDVYRSSGPGGQSVNTTDSAVRVTHLPT